MKCESEFKDINYGADLFCKTCGMDIELDPIKKHIRGEEQYYCCIECSRGEK